MPSAFKGLLPEVVRRRAYAALVAAQAAATAQLSCFKGTEISIVMHALHQYCLSPMYLSLVLFAAHTHRFSACPLPTKACWQRLLGAAPMQP